VWIVSKDSKDTITAGHRSDGRIEVLARCANGSHAAIDMDHVTAAWVRDELSRLLPPDPRMVALEKFVGTLAGGDLKRVMDAAVLQPEQLGAFVALIHTMMEKADCEAEEVSP